MKPPSNLTVTISCTCNECNAAVEEDLRLDRSREAVNNMRNALDDAGWQPLMLGKQCVGMLCAKCTKKALDTYDEADNSDFPIKSEKETSDTESPT